MTIEVSADDFVQTLKRLVKVLRVVGKYEIEELRHTSCATLPLLLTVRP